MHSQGESFQSPTTTLYVSLVTLMDTLHETVRKPNAVAAQNKRDAIWAEKNRVQASELQEINKLIKEAERL